MLNCFIGHRRGTSHLARTKADKNEQGLGRGATKLKRKDGFKAQPGTKGKAGRG